MRCADFLRTRNRATEVNIENILRVDLDGDGEDEVLISATNYFSKDGRMPMRSPAGVIRWCCTARRFAGKWKRS